MRSNYIDKDYVREGFDFAEYLTDEQKKLRNCTDVRALAEGIYKAVLHTASLPNISSLDVIAGAILQHTDAALKAQESELREALRVQDQGRRDTFAREIRAFAEKCAKAPY
jgi:hypothetical protein